MRAERQLLSTVAKLYYEDNHTQAEIADRLGVSRPKVSRLLSEAREGGIVKIFIESEDETLISSLENKLFSAFKLKGVKVVSIPDNDDSLAVQITANAGAEFLSNYINDGDRIGMGWGWTMYEMSKAFPYKTLEGIQLCQITGSVYNAKTKSYANEIIGEMSNKLGAQTAYTLPCPAMVDSPIISDTLMHDVKLREVLQMAQQCNKLFVNIALADEGSCLYQAGYLRDEDLQALNDNGATGSICSRFYNEDGNLCCPDIDARTIGISLDDIKNAECVLACLVGQKKARAIYCALKAHLLDVLVIDSITASMIVEILERGQA